MSGKDIWHLRVISDWCLDNKCVIRRVTVVKHQTSMLPRNVIIILIAIKLIYDATTRMLHDSGGNF